MRVILRPAFSASARHRWSIFKSLFSSVSSPVGLGTPMLARHRNACGMNDLGFRTTSIGAADKHQLHQFKPGNAYRT
jgi:hypothetical protein